MRNLGVTLTEIAWLDDLADACAADGRWSFLYVAAPLKVVDGHGRAGQPDRHPLIDERSTTNGRGWPATAPGSRPTSSAEFDDALAMFAATVRAQPRRRRASATSTARITFAELDALTDAFAAALVGRAASQPGDRVGDLPAERAAVRDRA